MYCFMKSLIISANNITPTVELNGEKKQIYDDVIFPLFIFSRIITLSPLSSFEYFKYYHFS